MARKWNKTFARAEQTDLNQCIACQEKEVSEQKTIQKGILDNGQWRRGRLCEGYGGRGVSNHVVK